MLPVVAKDVHLFKNACSDENKHFMNLAKLLGESTADKISTFYWFLFKGNLYWKITRVLGELNKNSSNILKQYGWISKGRRVNGMA